MGPLIRFQERRGAAVKFFGRAARHPGQARAKEEPVPAVQPGPAGRVRDDVREERHELDDADRASAHLHGKGEYEHLHEIVPWPDTTVMPFFKRYAIPIEEATHWEQSPERKRVIKTHFNWDMLPYSDQARYIAVIRDPKESSCPITCSSETACTARRCRPWTRGIDLFLSPQFPLGGSWAANTAGYWAERHRPNVLIVSFKVDETRSAWCCREGRTVSSTSRPRTRSSTRCAGCRRSST